MRGAGGWAGGCDAAAPQEKLREPTIDHQCAPNLPRAPAEVGNLESWLLARVAWMDGEMGKQRAPGAAAAPAGRR